MASTPKKNSNGNASLCACGSMRQRMTAGPQASFPGRDFFRCDSCGVFEWADAAPSRLFSGRAGPLCKCNKATVERTVKKEGPTKGRYFWSCAKWPHGCGFFQFQESNDNSNGANSPATRPRPPSTPQKRPALPGFASYLSDWNTLQNIQNMMHVDPKTMKNVSRERSRFQYDKLEVTGVWRIQNPTRWERYEKAKSLERKSSNDSKLAGKPKFEMPQEYETTMNELSKEQLESGCNEVMLLHGTDPDKLYSILFEGLDPAVAAKGNFGRGVYFAESAAKIDQYATEDRKFSRENEASDLYKFHKEIYKQLMHPHNVYYCLISRVLLANRMAFTKDGRTHMNDPGKFLFLDEERRRLAPMDSSDGVTKIPTALIGEPGERVETYREYVIFEPERIFVEYLVAYKRVRSLCDCGLPVIQRTVVANTVNRGRKLIRCPKSEEEACSFVQLFPLCDCGLSAHIATSSSKANPGRRYYTCNHRGRRRSSASYCDFFQWVDVGKSTSPSPAKRAKQGGD